MMFQLTKKATEERLRGIKKLTVNGMRFKIRKVNPLLDFHSDNIPTIFTDLHYKRLPDIKKTSMEDFKRTQKDMYATIFAGVVEPELVPVGAKGGITPEDLFREPSLGIKLYYEILEHSLNKFRGLTKVFFSIGLKLFRSMLFVNGMDNALRISSSKPMS